MTTDGTIMVDGILASCYAFSDHDTAHLAVTPIRWFPRLIEKIFGRDNESPAYVNVVAQLARMVMQSGIN